MRHLAPLVGLLSVAGCQQPRDLAVEFSFAGAVVFEQDFEARDPGPYTEDELSEDFNDPPWNSGVESGRATIIRDDDSAFLRLDFPAGGFGSGESGGQWLIAIEPHRELTLSYRVRFREGFEFTKGGLLPGLGGGGLPQADDAGWLARHAWGAAGLARNNVHHPDQESPFGENMTLTAGETELTYPTGDWLELRSRVVLNDPGQANGIVQTWLDGRLVLDRRDLRLQDDGTLIEFMYLSTFIGGDSIDWASPIDQWIDYDDFMVRAPSD